LNPEPLYIDHLLDTPSLVKAVSEGERRQRTNEALRLVGRNMGPSTGSKALDIHVLGAKGELAVAQYLNLEAHVFQDETPTRGSVDLPPNIDVKTRSKHWMDLVIQVDDSRTKVFVHATSEDDVVRLHGWTYGGRVMKAAFYQDPAKGRPAYFVRPWALFPMPQLQAIIADLRY
jgi:hypothetical protein